MNIFGNRTFKKMIKAGLTSVVLATIEAEIRKISIQGQIEQKVSESLFNR
jgi:hypothetical protein